MNGFIFPLCLGLALVSGCVSVRVGTQEDSSSLRMKGLANGYASVNGIRPYDGTFFELGILKKSRRSHEFEVVSVGLWPLVGLGVGIAGVRVQVLFLDTGVGVFAYDPEPPSWGQEEEEGKHENGAGRTPGSSRPDASEGEGDAD